MNSRNYEIKAQNRFIKDELWSNFFFYTNRDIKAISI